MQGMTMRRVLQVQQRNPCLHNSIHGLGVASAVASTTHNASSTACHQYASSSSYAANGHGGSPIPYLLAGLAAMLALVAVSLFILACSYWKLVGCVEQHAAAQAASSHPAPAPPPQDYADMSMMDASEDNLTKVVVIMAGHDKPTFLAQPMADISTV